MAEKGKIIQINFDGNVKESSISGNENAITVTGNDYNYIPGGQESAKTYGVEKVGPAYKFAAQDGVKNGSYTDVFVRDGDLKVKGADVSQQSAPLTYWTTSDSSYPRGFIIEVTGGGFKLGGIRIYPEQSGTKQIRVHKIESNNVTDANTRIYSQNFTVSSYRYYDLVFTTPVELEDGGRYWIGNESDDYIDCRYGPRDSDYPIETITGIKITGYKNYSSTTISTSYNCQYCGPMILSPGEPDPGDDGTAKFEVSTNEVTNVTASIIEWTEVTPAGASVVVSTGISDTEGVEPSYTTVTNGGTIPGISLSEDLTGKYLWVKIELEVGSGGTPEVSDLVALIKNTQNNQAIWLLIEGWDGFNKDTGQIRIQYNATTGTLAGDSSGNPQIEDFDISFTPTALLPINNPGVLEAIGCTLGDLTITRQEITFIKNYPKEAINAALSGIAITRTHIDDLDP